MWSRRWSAWCWKSSTPVCATHYTTTPTWSTHCSTRGSFSSSSGCTRPFKTSCRTWTRSVSVGLFSFYLWLLLKLNVQLSQGAKRKYVCPRSPEGWCSWKVGDTLGTQARLNMVPAASTEIFVSAQPFDCNKSRPLRGLTILKVM